MNRAFPALAASLLLASALTLGCSDDESLPEPTRTPASGAEANPSAGTPIANPPDATPPTSPPLEEAAAAVTKQLREKIELPSYYPDDAPVYPDAEPSRAQQAPTGRVSIVFGTDDGEEEAARVMTEQAEGKGWSIDSEDVIERGRITRASKDGRTLMILTNRLDDAADTMTLVAVTVDP